MTKTEPQRTITPSSTCLRERNLVASILSDPGGNIGPNIATALAYCPKHWESPESRAIGYAIKLCLKEGRKPTDVSVSEWLRKEDRDWLFNPCYRHGLPLEIAEVEAKELVIRYHGKAVCELLGDAWQSCRNKPHDSKALVTKLLVELERLG